MTEHRTKESGVLHSAMSTSNGTLVELREYDDETLALVFSEPHRPTEVDYALAFSPRESRRLVAMLTQAADSQGCP